MTVKTTIAIIVIIGAGGIEEITVTVVTIGGEMIVLAEASIRGDETSAMTEIEARMAAGVGEIGIKVETRDATMMTGEAEDGTTDVMIAADVIAIQSVSENPRNPKNPRSEYQPQRLLLEVSK